MKTFLTTTKGKAIAGIGTLAVVAAVVIAVLVMNKGYRTIAVEELNGTTSVENNGSKTDAYVGQHLKSGDGVSVNPESDMTLSLDTDKYVYAAENTKFHVEAVGKEQDTRTTIKLEEGSTLLRIDNKLGSSEEFNVSTGNATMSVRGTVFGVKSIAENTGDKYTVVDVYEGEVFVQVHMENGQDTEESRTLKAGESATIRSNSEISEFVKSDSEDVIDYSKLSQAEARFLGRAIDEGRNLSIAKELLFDIVEINEHDFSDRIDEVEPTCIEDGYYYEACKVCGVKGEKRKGDDKLGHDYVPVNGDETELECTRCKDRMTVTVDEEEAVEEEAEEEQEPQKPEEDKKEVVKQDPCAADHSFVMTHVEPTCSDAGSDTKTCSVCGYSETAILNAYGHNFVKEEYDATCTTDGLRSEICTRCGGGSSETISRKGHSRAMDSDNSYHWEYCTNCGEVFSKSSHDYGSSRTCSCGRRSH